MLDTRAGRARAWKPRTPTSAPASCRPSSAVAPLRRRPVASSSRSSRRRPTARRSRSAAATATRASGSAPACGIWAAACCPSARPGDGGPLARERARGRPRSWADLVEGDALEVLPGIDDVFDVVFLDAAKPEYEAAERSPEARRAWRPDRRGQRSPPRRAGPYSRARQADPGLLSVTVPLDRGLELSVALTDSL